MNGLIQISAWSAFPLTMGMFSSHQINLKYFRNATTRNSNLNSMHSIHTLQFHDLSLISLQWVPRKST